jgi:hypothetical protein
LQHLQSLPVDFGTLPLASRVGQTTLTAYL